MVNPEIYDESTLEVSRDLIESNTDMAKMDIRTDRSYFSTNHSITFID